VEHKTTLEWCAANEVSFKIIDKDGIMAITGRWHNISATYEIGEPFSSAEVGQSVYAALFSVERGSKFHAEFGDFPPDREAAVGDSENGNNTQTEKNATSPNLRTHPEPRRGELDSESRLPR
jgi:hypothetical protein